MRVAIQINTSVGRNVNGGEIKEMDDDTKMIVFAIIVAATILTPVVVGLYVWHEDWLRAHPDKTLYNSKIVSGRQSFMVGPEICNLTWSVKFSQVAHMWYWEHRDVYVYDYSYTSLLGINASLVLREVGGAEANTSQTILIEPKVDGFLPLVKNDTSFAMSWIGNITKVYYNWGSGAYTNVYSAIWNIPTLTFSMVYYILDTDIAGTTSITLLRSFD